MTVANSYLRRSKHGAEQGQSGAHTVTIFDLETQRTGTQKKTQLMNNYFTVRGLKA